MCCELPLLTISFLLHGLLSSLGLAALHGLGGGGLDDTNGDSLSHVTDSKPGEERIRIKIQRMMSILFTFQVEDSQ